MTAGEKLRTWRLSKGLSQEAAGRLFATSQARWCRLEAGSSLPGANEALRIDRGTGGAVPVEAWPAKPSHSDDDKDVASGLKAVR